MNRLSRHIAPMMFVALLLTSLITGCQRKPLYLVQHGNVSIATSEYDIRLEVLWGADWQVEWQYPLESWNEDIHGCIGYEEPKKVHIMTYQLDDKMQRCRWYNERFISPKGGRINLATNESYDILLYNPDTEWILFTDRDEHRSNPTGDLKTFNVTTRTNSRAQYTRTYAGYNQPDQLFGTLIDDIYISDDPDDYVIEQNEDGSVTYVCKMDATLQPYTFIYLYQVILRNNRTEKGDAVITSASGVTANGLASGTDLFTRRTHSNVVSITQENVAPLVKDYLLTLPDGTKEIADILGARIQTWGMPSIVPLEELTRGGTEPVDSTFVGVGLNLHNGYKYVMQKNVTEQMKEKPAGGVITLVIDIPKEIPDSIINRPTVSGGFDATVKDWDNEVNADLEI